MANKKKILNIINLILLLMFLFVMILILFELINLNNNLEEYMLKFDGLSNFIKNK